MNDDRLKTIWEGFTHAPLGGGEMEALRFVRDEAVKTGIKDQNEVDWSVVREAVVDTCDENGIGGPKSLQSAFKSCGLLVAHEPDDTANVLANGPHDHDHL
jgi:hypothetical protein